MVNHLTIQLKRFQDDFSRISSNSTRVERTAFRFFQNVDWRILNPVEDAKREGYWKSAYERQSDSYSRAFLLLVVTLLASFILNPSGYVLDASLSLIVVLAEIIIDLILAKRHGERLELDFYEQRKSVYYFLLMAQVLGWNLITIRGVEFEL